MRTPLIAGNWKMNKTIGEALELVKALHYGLQYTKIAKVEIIVAPTYISLNKVAEFLKDSFIGVAAQDLFWEDYGAFTGAISAPIIKDAGAKYVIIGHSERRQFFYETDGTINKKIKAALTHSIVPIFCVGESLAEREAGKVNVVIETQISAGLMDINPEEMAKIAIAYEPVWAIGTDKTATPEQAEEIHAMIRKLIVKRFGQAAADVVRILYGGSVKPSNSKELSSKPNIDGALVGGASLKADDFIGIIKNFT